MIQTVKTSQEKLKKLECEDGTVHEIQTRQRERESEIDRNHTQAFQK